MKQYITLEQAIAILENCTAIQFDDDAELVYPGILAVDDLDANDDYCVFLDLELNYGSVNFDVVHNKEPYIKDGCLYLVDSCANEFYMRPLCVQPIIIQ